MTSRLPFDTTGSMEVPVGHNTDRRRWRLALAAIAAAALAIPAAAQTIDPDNEGFDPMRQISTQFVRPNILLVFDVSGSMAWDEINGHTVGTDQTGSWLTATWALTGSSSCTGTGSGTKCKTWTAVLTVRQTHPSRMATVKNALGDSMDIITPWSPPGGTCSDSDRQWPSLGWSGGTITGPTQTLNNTSNTYWEYKFTWIRTTSSAAVSPGNPFSTARLTAQPPTIGCDCEYRAAADLIGKTKDTVNWGLEIFSGDRGELHRGDTRHPARLARPRRRARPPGLHAPKWLGLHHDRRGPLPGAVRQRRHPLEGGPRLCRHDHEPRRRRRLADQLQQLHQLVDVPHLLRQPDVVDHRRSQADVRTRLRHHSRHRRALEHLQPRRRRQLGRAVPHLHVVQRGPRLPRRRLLRLHLPEPVSDEQDTHAVAGGRLPRRKGRRAVVDDGRRTPDQDPHLGDRRQRRGRAVRAQLHCLPRPYGRQQPRGRRRLRHRRRPLPAGRKPRPLQRPDVPQPPAAARQLRVLPEVVGRARGGVHLDHRRRRPGRLHHLRTVRDVVAARHRGAGGVRGQRRLPQVAGASLRLRRARRLQQHGEVGLHAAVRLEGPRHRGEEQLPVGRRRDPQHRRPQPRRVAAGAEQRRRAQALHLGSREQLRHGADRRHRRRRPAARRPVRRLRHHQAGRRLHAGQQRLGRAPERGSSAR